MVITLGRGGSRPTDKKQSSTPMFDKLREMNASTPTVQLMKSTADTVKKQQAAATGTPYKTNTSASYSPQPTSYTPVYSGKVSSSYVPGTLGNQKVGSSGGGTSSSKTTSIDPGNTPPPGFDYTGVDLPSGGDAAYNDYYNNLLAEQQKAAQLRTQAALEANNAYIPQVNQYADRRLQDAYISKELNRVNMPQQLSALGYSGGATETSMMDAQTGYENRRGTIEQDRNQALGDIRQNAAQIEATGNAGLADLSANYYQNLVNKQMRDQENALTQNRWQTEFDADRSDAAYRDQLEMAKLKASYGDYSGLQALGISVNALNDMNGSTPMTKAAPAKVTATTPTSSGNYNTVLNNVKRALGGSNAGSQMSWNAAVNYIQNSLKNGTITEYEAQQMLGQLGLD